MVSKTVILHLYRGMYRGMSKMHPFEKGARMSEIPMEKSLSQSHLDALHARCGAATQNVMNAYIRKSITPCTGTKDPE